MKVLPALDVLDGKVVRLRRGDYSVVTVYSEDPVATARGWVEDGAELIHLVDLEGARQRTPHLELWESMAAAGIPFQLGGGLRTAAIARQALEAGAARVVLGTAAVWETSVLADIGEPERVVAALDVREGRATGAGWLDEGLPLDEVIPRLIGASVGRVLLTGIDRDGTLGGPDLGLVERVRGLAPGLRIVASGGVAGLDDLIALRQAGAEAAVVGRALYEGAFSLGEAITAAG